MPEIEVSEFVLERLEEDQKHFQETINESYNLNDTIHEYQKILDLNK